MLAFDAHIVGVHARHLVGDELPVVAGHIGSRAECRGVGAPLVAQINLEK